MRNLFFVFTFVLLFVITGLSYSQSIYFCDGVDDSGNPIGAGNKFSIPFKGGSVYALVKLDPATNCSEVTYDIYLLNNNNESFYTTVSQNGLSNKWNWFWKSIWFDYAGDYRVYVNDCNGKLLVKGDVKIIY